MQRDFFNVQCRSCEMLSLHASNVPKASRVMHGKDEKSTCEIHVLLREYCIQGKKSMWAAHASMHALSCALDVVCSQLMLWRSVHGMVLI